MKRARNFKAWKTMRECHLRTYPECRICEDPENVVVHHLCYRGPRGESEHPGDLVTLCTWHHDRLHALLGSASPRTVQLAWIAEQEAACRGEVFA